MAKRRKTKAAASGKGKKSSRPTKSGLKKMTPSPRKVAKTAKKKTSAKKAKSATRQPKKKTTGVTKKAKDAAKKTGSAKKAISADEKARKANPRRQPSSSHGAPNSVGTEHSRQPEIGAEAPAFSLPLDNGGNFTLADWRGQKNVVLYFYPKADTPGCTIQACAFQRDSHDYAQLGAVVVGVSPDGSDALRKFRNKYTLGFPLAGDQDNAVAKAYGVWVEKNMYGRRYMGMQRATFIIDKQGRIAAAWPKVKVEGHSEEVLAALKQMSA